MIDDPNDQPNPTHEDDGSAAAAAQAAETAAGSETPPEVTDAFTQGVEAAREQEGAEDAPVAADGDTQPEAAAPPAAPAADPAQAAEPAPEPDTVDAELKELGITHERTQKRFRELSERAAEADALRPQVERAQQWEETVQSTGATPEQMGNALGYLAAVNSRDPQQMAKAYDFMQQEMAWLAKELGRPGPGYDPLAEHAELAKQVEAGDLSRATAQELIQARRTLAMQQDGQQRQRQQFEQQAAVEQAQEQAVQQVQALGVQLRTADPQHFEAKFRSIQPMVQMIQNTLPPQQWAQAIQQAYMAAPTPIAVPPATSPARPNNPARATGVDLSKAPTKENAFDFGVQLAREQGR